MNYAIVNEGEMPIDETTEESVEGAATEGGGQTTETDEDETEQPEDETPAA